MMKGCDMPEGMRVGLLAGFLLLVHLLLSSYAGSGT